MKLQIILNTMARPRATSWAQRSERDRRAPMRRSVAVVITGAALLATACGDSGGSGSTGDGPILDSWLYVQTTIEGPDGRSSFLQLLPDLDIDRLDTSNAVELAGNARVFSDGRRIFTGSAEEPVIQEWLVRDNGRLDPGTRVSFAEFGLAFVPFGHNFVSDTKAYLFDGPGARALAWNPRTIELSGTVPLPGIRKEPILPEIDPGVLRGNELFAVVQHNDFGTGAIFEGLQVVVVDTETDQVVSVTEDTRCVGSFAGIQLAEDGTVYVLGDNYLVWTWVGDDFSPTCVLRILPGETEFDPEFLLDLEEITGEPSSGFFYAGDGIAYTQAMDEDATAVDPRSQPQSFLNEAMATWWEIDLNDLDRSRPLEGLGLASPRSGSGYRVDGRIFIQRSEEAFFGNTDLVEVNADGTASPTFDYSGLITNFGRVQLDPL
ncbi:MAG: hypothetical protein AAF605_07300 [Myxococcota bacterium]